MWSRRAGAWRLDVVDSSRGKPRFMRQNSDLVMDHLLRLHQSGQTHLFIKHAHQALSQHTNAPDLAKLTLRVLVEQGLGGPARELIQLRRDLDHADAEVSALKERAGEVPNGRVAWNDRRDVFERNLAALSTKGNVSHDAGQRFARLLSGVHLFRTSEGHYQIARRRAGRLREWWPSLTSLGDELRVTLPARGELGPTGIVGVSYGNLVPRICELTHQLSVGYSHPIFVVEPDETRFAAWLHCADHTGWLSDERILVFVGEDALSELEQALLAEPDLPAPIHFVNFSGDAELLERVRVSAASVGERRVEMLDQLMEPLEQRYRDRDEAYWAERWVAPGRVLAFTSRFTTVLQYSTRDAMLALADLGYETHTLVETRDYNLLSPITVCRKLLEVDPDFILLLDHLRREHSYLPKNLPFLTWIQDPLPNLLSRQAGQSVGPLDFVCGFYKQRCVEEFDYPKARFFPTSIPVSTRHFHDGPVVGPEDKELRCDLMYAGNLQHTAESYFDELRSQSEPAVHGLLELIRQDVNERLVSGDSLVEPEAKPALRRLVQRAGISLSEEVLEWLSTFGLFRMFDISFRMQTLGWAADWAGHTGRRFRLYGDGWERHPTLCRYAVGRVEHGEPLRRAYRGAKLVLQTIAGGFLHQRTQEALVSGALVLARYMPTNFARLSIEEFQRRRSAGEKFSETVAAVVFPELHRVTFRNAAEFERISEQFLNNDVLQHETWQDLIRIVHEKFTYTAIVADILKQVRTSLAASAELVNV